MLTRTVCWAGLIVTVLLGASAARPLFQEDLPEGKGRETLENTCTECHGLDRVLAKLRTAREWRAIAVRMRSKGASMSADELNALVAYLSQNFGAPEANPEKVNVNHASAAELETALGLDAAEAAAIVHHRESKGSFHKWRDLLEVEGVGRAHLEAVKGRVVF